MRYTQIVLAMAVSGIAALSVAQTATKPAFEVASIKQSVFPSDAYFVGYIAAAGACGKGRPVISGNRVTLRQISVCGLISTAYDMRDYLISPGAIDWIKKEDRGLIYEIQATAPDAAGQLTPERAREMLQTLLADRFQLRVHREIREASIYALVVGKNGPKLNLSANGPCAQHPNASLAFSTSFGPGGQRRGGGSIASCKGVTTMAQLAQDLSRDTDRPVVDQTGIEGGQLFELHWSADGADVTDAPSMFTAVQDQMGLKLEATKAMVEVLVIDNVQRPSEN